MGVEGKVRAERDLVRALELTEELVQLKLALGLLGGVAIALPAMVMGMRVPFLAGGSSWELADALDAVVVPWLDGLAPPKRKKRRKKKRPPPE